MWLGFGFDLCSMREFSEGLELSKHSTSEINLQALVFRDRSCYVAQAGPELKILTLIPKCWDDR